MDKLKIGQEVLIHGYVDEIRKDTIIIQNEGGYFGTVECEITDIEMPNTNEVLDKICDEILEYIDDLDIAAEICDIFDKYKTESEDKE